MQENEKAVAEFIARHDLSYPFALDTSGDIGQMYNIVATPTTFFIDPSGVVTSILPGFMTQDWLDGNMAALQG